MSKVNSVKALRAKRAKRLAQKRELPPIKGSSYHRHSGTTDSIEEEEDDESEESSLSLVQLVNEQAVVIERRNLPGKNINFKRLTVLFSKKRR